jgi:hypothetical protein
MDSVMRDFLISVASGFAVAVLSAIFLRGPFRGNRNAPSQSMNMSNTPNAGFSQFLFFFLLGGAAAFAILMYAQGQISFNR